MVIFHGVTAGFCSTSLHHFFALYWFHGYGTSIYIYTYQHVQSLPHTPPKRKKRPTNSSGTRGSMFITMPPHIVWALEKGTPLLAADVQKTNRGSHPQRCLSYPPVHWNPPSLPGSPHSGSMLLHGKGISRAAFQDLSERPDVLQPQSPGSSGLLAVPVNLSTFGDHCGWTNPFRTTLKPWLKPLFCWHLQGNHHSRAS